MRLVFLRSWHNRQIENSMLFENDHRREGNCAKFLWRWHVFDTLVTQALSRVHTKRQRWCQRFRFSISPEPILFLTLVLRLMLTLGVNAWIEITVGVNRSLDTSMVHILMTILENQVYSIPLTLWRNWVFLLYRSESMVDAYPEGLLGNQYWYFGL